MGDHLPMGSEELFPEAGLRVSAYLQERSLLVEELIALEGGRHPSATQLERPTRRHTRTSEREWDAVLGRPELTAPRKREGDFCPPLRNP
jgi:hypothetical protein